MVTVWPEVLKTSSYCLSDEQCPLVHTLKLVLLSWAQKPQSADLGNILRVLCCWGDDSVTEEVLKDLGLQLIKLLHEERAASVRIGTGKTITFFYYSTYGSQGANNLNQPITDCSIAGPIFPKY